MGSTGIVRIVPGFSPANRVLIYLNLLLAPTQLFTSFDTQCPSNIGFMAYNLWQQYLWFNTVKTHQLHALSLAVGYMNFIYAITYLGGISAGNMVIFWLQGLGVAGLITLNTVTAWISVQTNLPDGDGLYQFWFFGWRVLTKGWRIFFICTQATDTLISLIVVVSTIAVLVSISRAPRSRWMNLGMDEVSVSWRFGAIAVGTVIVLVIAGPLIAWTELIVKKNNIVSRTDMVSVYLFVAQVVAMILPALGGVGWACYSYLIDRICSCSVSQTTTDLPMAKV